MLLLAVSLALALGLAELGIRAAGITSPPRAMSDPTRGSAPRPNVRVWFHGEGGGRWIQQNSAGFRDIERVPQKPAGCFRIAVLGDSYVDALQVEREERFTELLEQELRDRGCLSPRQVEVLNFGVSGYGTTQELMTLRHHVWRYEPDLVILAFYPWNDLRNNSRVLQNDPNRPYFELRSGELVLDDSFLESSDYRKNLLDRAILAAVEHSAILQLVYEVRAQFKKRAERSQAEGQRPPGSETGLDNDVYREPEDDVWRDAWAVTEAMLRQMSREVREHNADFLVAIVSTAIQVHPDRSAQENFRRSLGVSDLFYPTQRVLSAGQRDGYAVLALPNLMAEWVEHHGEHLHGFGRAVSRGHWNRTGHRVAATLLADELCGRFAGR